MSRKVQDLERAIAEDEVFARLVLSFATPEEDVDSFLALAMAKA